MPALPGEPLCGQPAKRPGLTGLSGYRLCLVVVALEAAYKSRMRSWGTNGVFVRVVTAKAFIVLGYPVMDIRMQLRGRAVKTQIVTIGATAGNEQYSESKK